MNQKPRVALVQEALPFIGGAEKVLEVVLEVFPEAPIFTLIYNRIALKDSIIAQQKIYTSFIDRLPYAHRKHRTYLPLFPYAIEQFDLRDYDVILSFSYAAAHGIVPRPDQLHISFIFTPVRYAWQEYHQYLKENNLHSGIHSWTAKWILHYMRLWDRAAADRVDHFVAVSEWISKCVWRAYRRKAQVIYPPVDINKFQPLKPRENYYLVVSRLTRHKRVDLIIEVFSRLKLPLCVVGEGEELKKLKKISTPNIQLLGRQPDVAVRQLMGKAKALVHAAEEDFGIALVEAQAAGCPVIAFGKGGALETVIEGKTGLFFSEPSVESLRAAIEQFEAGYLYVDPEFLRRNAEQFAKERFIEKICNLVQWEWERFSGGGNGR